MGDIIDMAIKEFEGKLRSNTAVQPSATTGDLGTLTANTGKDMYLARAKASIKDTGGAVAGQLKIELLVNGIVRDRWFTSMSRNTNIGGHVGNTYDFMSGFKVTTGQTIKLRVDTAATNVEVSGTVECFEEDTGVSPQIPTI